MAGEDEPTRADEDRLNGWKEIAQHIGKDRRTAQRWKERGMPVHRVGAVQGAVFAFRSEIDRWAASPSGLAATKHEAQESAGEPDDPAKGDSALAEHSNSKIERFSARRCRWMATGLVGLGAGALIALTLVDFRRPSIVVLTPTPRSGAQGHNFVFETHDSGGHSRVWRWTRAPNGREGLLQPAISPDSAKRFAWALSTDCTTETGQHGLGLADEDGRVLSNIVSIDVLPNARCRSELPDLVAEGVDVSPPEAKPGDLLVCRFVVRNQGAGRAEPSMTRLRLNTSPERTGPRDPALGDIPTPALASGEAATLEHRVAIPVGISPGRYHVWVVADNGGANLEKDSVNNFAHSGVIVIGNPTER